MRKWIWLISLLAILFPPVCLAADKALVLEINSPIGPAAQDFIVRGIQYAEAERASLIILQLNTPGGLETSMRGINAAILASPIPIVAYVAPTGARAASAGTFILYASHLAVMAPGTNIGAASPVTLEQSSDTSNHMHAHEKKAMSDAAAYIRSLAQLRGRNVEWAEKAVTQAASLSAVEAKKINVINDIADNYADLLNKIDGKKVAVQGTLETIHSQHLQTQKIETDWRYDFLSFLTNPNIAYILMLIAIYGLFFELSNPGLVLPGVAGVIALLLALYAFQLMPVNYAGLTLILIGITFMTLEIYLSSYGIIGIGGMIAFVLGSIMLFDFHDQHFKLDWQLVASMSIITLAFFFLILTLALRSHKQRVKTGKEGLIGSEGIVLSVMNEQVIVRVAGEMWEARSPVMLNEGQIIRVKKVKGLLLIVEPINNEHHHSGE